MKGSNWESASVLLREEGKKVVQTYCALGETISGGKRKTSSTRRAEGKKKSGSTKEKKRQTQGGTLMRRQEVNGGGRSVKRPLLPANNSKVLPTCRSGEEGGPTDTALQRTRSEGEGV